MSAVHDRLRRALVGRYEIKNPIGAGGMSEVFLAKDLKHGRPVAIKVFRPDVAMAMGPERFLREIRTAANLNHPNILPLFDSGEDEGLLYFVMPFVEGHSLADRIAREGQLPIDEALSILRQVAAALHYAHKAGVVHRDIKPANILLSGSTAMVADFGVAQALENSTEMQITGTGLAIGTPAYMSPEQAEASVRLDARADIYSLGCVLFEMVAGEPPFTGKTTHAILARQSQETAPLARTLRASTPIIVDQAITKALAKSPADRFQTAEEFARALSPERLMAGRPILSPRAKRVRLGSAIVAAAAVGVLGFGIISGRIAIGARAVAPVDPNLVAVMPFHAGAGSDSALAAFAAGMADLVAQRLRGEGTLQAVFPGTVQAALAREAPQPDIALGEGVARRVAQRTGAGLMLLGQVSRVGDQISLSATLAQAHSGQMVARVENLVGAIEPVSTLLDRLVATVLLDATREPREHYPELTRLSLPVLRTYLAARRAYLRGRFEEAVQFYGDVLQSDSTIGSAAIGMAVAGQFTSETADQDAGIRRALLLKGRIGREDSVILASLTYRDWPVQPTIPERLFTWQRRAAEAAPNRVEVWYQLGDVLFHDGPWTGAPDILQRAGNAFRRALALDSTMLPALGHLIDLAASAGDTATVRELGRSYLEIDSAGPLSDYYRWRVAVAIGDERSRATVMSRADSLDRAALERIVNVGQLDGTAIGDATRAAEALWSQSGLENATRWAFVKLEEIALNRGKPTEANAIVRRRIANNIPLRPRDRLSAIVNALFWDADTSFAAELARQREDAVDRSPATAPADDNIYYEICGVSLWRLAHGDVAGTSRGIAKLNRVRDPLASSQTAYIRLCADVLETRLAHLEERPDARRQLERLDSLARTAPATITWMLAAANLTSAQLWEKHGDIERALNATRRRPHITDFGEPRVLVALSTFLREEGRLAHLAGDTTGALRAYAKYLALRRDAEPSGAAEVARVTEEFRRLSNASGQRRRPGPQAAGTEANPPRRQVAYGKV